MRTTKHRTLSPRRAALVLASAVAVAAPAVAVADESELADVRFVVPGGQAIQDGLEDHAHGILADRAVRLTRRAASLRGTEFRAARHREALEDWSVERVQRRVSRLRSTIEELRETGGAPDVAIPAALAGIAACESGGDPGAIGGGGLYRGKYQFDMGTWASVGGSGDPAAAPEVEQDRRAAMLYARAGATPWPVCGR